MFSAAVMALTSVQGMSLPAFAASVGDKLSVTSPSHQQERGNCDGYSYEVWIDNTGGNGSMTLGSGGTFKTEWSASMSKGNFLARRGMSYDSLKKKATSFDTVVLNYEADYTASSQGNSRLCVYGWYRDPLVEYYIIEDWKNWCPAQDTRNKQDSKIVKIDDAEYEIFWMYHTGPDINGGNSQFKQYYSVRQNRRTSGSITVTDHFKAWENAGWGIGSLYEIALNVEGWESSGSANITKLTLSDTPDPDIDPGTNPGTDTPSVKYDTPSGSGSGVSDGFEKSGTDWKARGNSVKLGLTSDMAHSGDKSLYITGRQNSWNGASCASSELKAGHTYNVSAYAAYKDDAYDSEGFTIGLLYNDTSGKTHYDDIVDASAKSGEWAKLDKDFTVPSGASDIALYIQTTYTENDTAKDRVSFFVDDVKLTDKGSSGTDEPETTKPSIPLGDLTGIPDHQNNDYTYDANGKGFKDYMGPFFRLGTEVNARNIQNGQMANFIKQNFNSITCENEMKPDYICDRSKSSGDNIAIKLDSAAPILKFCEENGIGLRGHTFVWYSQTPGWIFNENFSDNGPMVSKDRMNKRLESMIKNTFDALKTQYPRLKVYAYDVCNELFKNDGGGFRGDGGEFSNWWTCYKDDSFVINAFKYARQYAPEGCKLYMNDYNEYFMKKRDDLYNMAKKILEQGDYIDGIGMQSHMHYCDFGYTGSATESKNSKFGTYADAIDLFNSLGLDVQITELDVTTCSEPQGADLFVDIFKVAMERSKRISSLTLWGHCDGVSWRKSYKEDDGKQGGNPLPFNDNCQPKEFYQTIIDLPKTVTVLELEAEETTTTTTTTTTEPPVITVKKLGDVDCDGEIIIADAILLARYNAEDKEIRVTEEGVANADVSGNGKVNAEDLSMLLEFLAGMRTF